MFSYILQPRSGLPTYLQLVHQVKEALRVRRLKPGDQLPTVRQVGEELGISANTVLKAYRELEREGLVKSKPAVGTFVERTLGAESRLNDAVLQRSLQRWMREAERAGLDEESVAALFAVTLRDRRRRGAAS
ncbi:MAG: GntR family transcriptional regulator [Candidatus Dormibacteraeota bacterium]|nr:GntR family transcriptional regulator [Candidatus Dormibacteraeota bacterium]